MQARIERGFYWENQIAFAYNSDKMEGSPLTEEQTRSIFETRTITGRSIPHDAAQEASNHFALFDRMLETYNEPITRELLWDYHSILKTGTADDLINDKPVRTSLRVKIRLCQKCLRAPRRWHFDLQKAPFGELFFFHPLFPPIAID